MTPWLDDGDVSIHVGDVRAVLAELPDESVDCVVTSPPYWGLRDYGTGSWAGGDPDCDHKRHEARAPHERRSSTLDGDVCGKCGAQRVDQQLGLEPTPDQYVANMVAVFREVRRVLAPYGTVFLNLGDSYNSHGTQGATSSASLSENGRPFVNNGRAPGLKHKDLVGIPWRVAFALQADGWWLRSDIVWSKSNPMPESVTDRPTKAHEYVFLLSKQPRYWFDQEAVREPVANGNAQRTTARYDTTGRGPRDGGNGGLDALAARMRDGDHAVRSVWEIATQPFAEAHFATFPEELVRRCLLAGCPAEVCSVCGKPKGAEVVRTPLGTGPSHDPTPLTGRKGMNRERRPDEGTRPITKAEQREYARQLRESPYRDEMAREAGEAFAHYVRTDDSGARPVPPAMLERWIGRGWLVAAEASGCGHHAYRPGLVLDPFLGSGTTALVARHHGRHAVGVELNQAYAEIAAKRLQQLSLGVVA